MYKEKNKMENNETILTIYDRFIDEIYGMSEERINYNKQILELETELNKTLTQEQKDMIQKMHDLENKSNECVTKKSFIFAYKMATKLLLEGLDLELEKDEE